MELKMIWNEPNLWLLSSGRRQVVIEELGMSDLNDAVLVPEKAKRMIEDEWQEVLKKNPKAFPGPTVRMVSHIDDLKKLCITVVASDYKHAMVMGWLGVAMVPITSDGYVALQAPVASIAATVGGGIRVPGCTPTNADFLSHIVKEMKEEFNVEVTQDQFTPLGLVEVLPPLAKRHRDLIVQVSLKETFNDLKAKWEGAEDKWEGQILPFKFTPENVITAIFAEKDKKKYGPVTPVALYLAARERFGDFGAKDYDSKDYD